MSLGLLDFAQLVRGKNDLRAVEDVSMKLSVEFVFPSPKKCVERRGRASSHARSGLKFWHAKSGRLTQQGSGHREYMFWDGKNDHRAVEDVSAKPSVEFVFLSPRKACVEKRECASSHAQAGLRSWSAKSEPFDAAGLWAQ